ncbi:MAG: LuxR C-terminal-related transcriptional regulator [Nocardioides sp.]
MSLEGGRGNLPRSTTTLVGRDAAVSELCALVRAGQLVTLTGTGGVGKTRLALEVAAQLSPEFADGVWLVELGPLADAAAVPAAVATALGIAPQGDARLIDTVAEALAGRRVLLVVDNCEHLLPSTRDAVSTILARSSTPRVLATSREGLDAAGETRAVVAPLGVDGLSSDAVTLFTERARGARPGFGVHDEQTAAAVVRICEVLDGLPLGIELAAARMAAMSAVEVGERLDQRFRLLTGPESGPSRQATLQDAVAWSYDLLEDPERLLLRRASAFAGGFELEALCAVAEAGDEIAVLRSLDSLVRKSLVVAHHGSARTRYSLFETIRAYAGEQLEQSDDGPATRDRHAAYHAGEAARRWERWSGPGWREEVDWVRAEVANLRTAYRWSLTRDDIATATDVVAHAALMGFSVELFETIAWAEEVLPAAERADVRRLPRLYAAAGYACFVGRPQVATAHAHRATELERDVRHESCEPGYATFIEALGQVYCGNLDRYVELTREVAALPGTGQAYGIAAYVDGLQSAGRVEEALELTDAAVAAARELGSPYWLAYTLWIVGLALSKADPERALAVWDEGTAVVAEHGVRFFEGFMSRDAALLHMSDGQLESALALFDTAISAFLGSGAVSQLVITLASLPALLEQVDQPGAARTLLAAMAQHPASFHHVPTLADLGTRLDARLGHEAAARYAATGGSFDLPTAAAYATHRIDVARKALDSAPGQGLGALTARETQVLRLIAEGASTREVAERLFISAKTADNHIQHIYTKLGVTNRAGATRWALAHELVGPPDDGEDA